MLVNPMPTSTEGQTGGGGACAEKVVTDTGIPVQGMGCTRCMAYVQGVFSGQVFLLFLFPVNKRRLLTAVSYPATAVGCPSGAVQWCAQTLSWLPDGPKFFFSFILTTSCVCQGYAEMVQNTINTKCPDDVAGFIAESIQGVGGQVVFPPGYLKAVYEKVRAAGGVCIADEVQVGFGRTGQCYWGFETQVCLPHPRPLRGIQAPPASFYPPSAPPPPQKLAIAGAGAGGMPRGSRTTVPLSCRQFPPQNPTQCVHPSTNRHTY